MPVDADVFLHDALAAQRDHRHRGIIPAGDVGPRFAASSQGHHSVWINVFVGLSRTMQIDSLHPPRVAHAAHDGHAVSEIVRRDQRGVIRCQRQSGRIERRLSCVVVGRRDFSGFADFKRWRRHFRIRPVRTRLERRGGLRIKMENPDFVFESSGNIHLKSAVRARG